MQRDGAILGMSLWNMPPAELVSIHSSLAAGIENKSLRPVIGQEMPLADAPRAHGAVMEENAHGKIVRIQRRMTGHGQNLAVARVERNEPASLDQEFSRILLPVMSVANTGAHAHGVCGCLGSYTRAGKRAKDRADVRPTDRILEEMGIGE